MLKIEILGDSPTTEDGLGFKSYVEILSDAINNSDVTSPLTIGIHGSWGSGKTSLMQMLEKKFKGYLFSIDREFEDALNNDNITKLKDGFKNDISLSSDATVEAVPQSQKSVNERHDGVLSRIKHSFRERSNYGTSSVANEKEDKWKIKQSLFSWDNVPGNDSERLLKFLGDNLDIGWAKNAEISKSDDHKTIHISKDKNSAEIVINKKEEKATLKIRDGKTYVLKVNKRDSELKIEIIYIAKKEQGKINIYKADNRFKTIWFNAWVHGREEPIGLALLHQMLTELKKEDGSKVKIGNVLANVGKLLVDVGLRKTTGITFEEAKDLFETSIETKNTLRDDFEKVIGECLPDKRLVVFIDDLDRCLPEKAIEIFEVIKQFLDVPRCVFVIGVAGEVIEQGIAAIYEIGKQKKLIEGKDYIEKIIQIPFTLPPIREEVMIRFIESLGYLFMFSWDNVPGNDSEGLQKFLRDDLDIDWASNAEISKFDDHKTIHISKDKNSAEITIDEKEENATLKISDGKTYDLKVNKEKGKLNIYSLGISEKEKKYAKIVAKGTECNPRKVKLFLNTLRLRLAIVDKSGGELNPTIAAKLFVIEYTFDDFYEDVKLYREQDFLWNVEMLARGEVYLFSWDNVSENDKEKLRNFLRDDLDIDWVGNAEISKLDDQIYIKVKDKNLAEIMIDEEKKNAILKISEGKTYDLKVKKKNDIYWEVDKESRENSKKSGTLLNKYCENEALMSLLKDEPFVGRINIDAYVHLSGIKPPEPEEVSGFDKSKLDVLLSGDWLKTDLIASEVRKMPNSVKEQYVKAIIAKLTDNNDDLRANAALALRMMGDANAVEPLIARLEEDKSVDVRTRAAWALGEIGEIGDANAVEPLIKALVDEQGDLRAGAARALGKIGGANAVEPLITALNDKDIAVRNKAEKALVKIGDEAVESLIGALDVALQKRVYPRMRECAVRTLGRIGDVRAINVLEKEANTDSYQAIRTVAKYALKEIEAKQN
jgi:hypothetical protein